MKRSSQRRIRIIAPYQSWRVGQEVDMDLAVAKQLVLRGIAQFMDKRRGDVNLRLRQSWNSLSKGAVVVMPREMGQALLRAKYAELLGK